MPDGTIDMTALSAKHTSEESARLMRKRHWSEWRLKAYGILALLVAVLALSTLIYTIAVKTLGVLNEYYLSLETTIEVSDREMARIDDPNPRLVPILNGVIRDATIEAVGGDIDRRERRELTALLSTDAGLELGRIVKSDQSLIGGSLLFDALLDDQVQLYLKGDLGKLKDAGVTGGAKIVGEGTGAVGDQLTVDFEPGSFGEARVSIRDSRAAAARVQRRIARNEARAVEEIQGLLDDATDEAARAGLQTRLDGFIATRDAANARADQLLSDATEFTTVFSLTDLDPTILIRINRGWIKVTELAPDSATGVVYRPLDSTEPADAGSWEALLFDRPEAERKLTDKQLVWLEVFEREGKIEQVSNTRLLFSSDSSNAELAGIWGALIGSFWTMIVTFLLAFPIGVMASIYLEEFAPKNRVTELIEVNINNLAAVPSIVFGLLGITVLISGVQLFGVNLFDGILKNIAEDPRSTPLAGGVVLALMSLPTIIIAARASIKAVPPSIKDAALGLGASRLQTATHHVLPLAMPGILTGTIIAMAQALGETAPLIIVGMNAFIQDPPTGPLDKANVLPSLIYLWNNQSERLFDGKTAAAISVLLIFLILMNALAVLLRKRFERRW